MTNRRRPLDNDLDVSLVDVSRSQERMEVRMHKLAHGGDYPGREDDEAAILAYCRIWKASALPGTGRQATGEPVGASPGAQGASLATAVSQGAPQGPTMREVGSHVAAPTALQHQEPVATPVSAAPCAKGSTAVRAVAKPAQEAAMITDDDDLPDANLAEAIADADRPSDTARPRKKATKASRAAAATAAQAVETTVCAREQRSSSGPAAARHPDEDGFVTPARRHTARAAVLQPALPLPTANAFQDAPDDVSDDAGVPRRPAASRPPPIVVQWDGPYRLFEQKIARVAPTASVQPGTSFADAAKGGAPAPSTQRPAASDGAALQQPAPSDVAAPPAPAPSAPAASPRRRRRRPRRTAPAAERPATAAPRQRPAPRAVSLQTSPPAVPPQPAVPALEAAPEVPTAPDAAELRTLLRSLSQLLEQLPVLVTAVTSALQAGVVPADRHGK
ncbi:nascent polypeptide-associated complex subunit alpha, muscle-specific form-like [Schistocerca serialis cubense]|uniref:nascent polypeptide-associated complex subunit alpha, muscle-specific form-like n=1 Tax=Schistocerca serialis cubense TaxID=2023355 RepID=UPI00214F21FB|nr:nascent polypeptide-associated complex subunit alpha, muscle-specific form-like [Schistocerca serialis cubense]